MKILSINAGSSSLKFSLFNMENNELLINGVFERIGINDSFVKYEYNGDKQKENCTLNNHEDAVKILAELLVRNNVINSLEDINAVGHRILHGGEVYKSSVLITDEVIEVVDKLKELGPLHNPANLMGINGFKKVLPNVPMVGVFDTEFHQTMDKEEYLYAVPYSWYKEYGIRKYGFHGTSHKYVSKTINEKLGRNDLKVISCHLGNGSSVTAIKDGKCIDTSMGLTPSCGLVMGTRCGDIDFSLIEYVMKKSGKTITEIMNDLNKNSGLLGISEISSDNRDIEDGIKEGKESCILAQHMLIKSIVKYISIYNTLLGGADIITFEGGIGENGIEVRKTVLNALNCLGVKVDDNANNVRGKFTKITTDDSKISAYIVPTNEELMIAQDTLKIISE